MHDARTLGWVMQTNRRWPTVTWISTMSRKTDQGSVLCSHTVLPDLNLAGVGAWAEAGAGTAAATIGFPRE